MSLSIFAVAFQCNKFLPRESLQLFGQLPAEFGGRIVMFSIFTASSRNRRRLALPERPSSVPERQ